MNRYCLKITFLGTNEWVLRKNNFFRYRGSRRRLILVIILFKKYIKATYNWIKELYWKE